MAQIVAAMCDGLAAARAARIEDYAELRALGECREQAARRVGVSVWTARQYDAELRATEALETGEATRASKAA